MDFGNDRKLFYIWHWRLIQTDSVDRWPFYAGAEIRFRPELLARARNIFNSIKNR